jgi:hypothetical protein
MISFIKMHKKFFLLALLFLVFIFSFSVHYSLYRSKGFVQTQYSNLLIARNWAETGQLSYENKENVTLSTESVKTEGIPNNLGNKLTFFLYGSLFRIFGFHPELPLYVAFILYSLTSALVFLIIERTFDWKTGLVAGLLINLAPFSLPYSQIVGAHEWAWFFLGLGSLSYFWPKERKLRYLILCGIFLALSSAAKNSFFVAFPAFVIVEFWHERESVKLALKRALLLIVSFIVVAIPLTFFGGNIYLTETFGLPGQNFNDSFTVFTHLFPDPYTFHYERESFIKNFIANKDSFPGGEFRLWGDVGSFLEEYGYKIGFLKAQIITRIFSLWIYFKGLILSSVVFGGLLSWLFIFIGTKELIGKKKQFILLFSATSFVSWLFFMVMLKTSNYVQLLIISLPVVFLVSNGLVKLSEIISNSITFKKIKPDYIALAVISMFLIFYAQVTWWTIRELSLDFGLRASVASFAKSESAKKPNDDWQKVTMTGWSRDTNDMLAYYLNKDFIYFNQDTIKKLAREGKLSDILKKYNISGFIGFDDTTNEIIKKNTKGLKEHKIY